MPEYHIIATVDLYVRCRESDLEDAVNDAFLERANDGLDLYGEGIIIEEAER